MSRILVIEDEQDLGTLLEYNLRADGHEAEVVIRMLQRCFFARTDLRERCELPVDQLIPTLKILHIDHCGSVIENGLELIFAGPQCFGGLSRRSHVADRTGHANGNAVLVPDGLSAFQRHAN